MYYWLSDTQVAKFQLFGSLLILTGYRLFLNPYRKVPEVSLQVTGELNCQKSYLLETFLSKRPKTILLMPLRTVELLKL